MNLAFVYVFVLIDLCCTATNTNSTKIFVMIESDEFSSKPLRKMQRLTFNNIKSIKFMSGWALGLNMHTLKFHNAMIKDMLYDFLLGSGLSLITIDSSFGNYNIINIFETSAGTLVYLEIRNATSIRRISGLHLFRFLWLSTLILNNCGIETIAENTFLRARYLSILELHGNHLKTLPATVFDPLLEFRHIERVYLMNNEWECYCDLLITRDHMSAYGFVFNDFPNSCPFTEMLDSNGKYKHGRDSLKSEKATIPKYKSCEMKIGFSTIFIRYPKFILKANISSNNLLIKSPTEQNNNYYYSIISHGKRPTRIHKSEKCTDYQSITCWIFKNPTESLSLNSFHGQKPKIYCFLDSAAKTGIWPYNCVSICKGCNEITNVWLRIPSTLWAAIISVIVGLACISIGMTLGFLLLWLNPKLLRGSKRVIFLQNTAVDCEYSYTVLVMPFDWENFRRQIERSDMSKFQQQIPSMPRAMCISPSYYDDYTDIGPYCEYLEFEPPLPPRPKSM